ncbi:MAG: aminodeoxychorismate lyase [Porphyromonadaceae bacterium CG2_30_38_12]|nr:MAG: aminodeoxychorismate lyase [Porphyromonadaceae bacterium CG2_30_38_12]
MIFSKNLFKNKPFLVFVAASILSILYVIYILFSPNISLKYEEDAFLYIPDNSSFEDVITHLKQNAYVVNYSSLKQTAKLLNYKKIRSGKYALDYKMSNFELIRKLRSGQQTPVKLTFNNIRTKEQLAAKLSKQLMADSSSIINLLNDTALLSANNFNPNTSVALFIPNTYEIFWDTDANELMKRMLKEYKAFWTKERIALADSIPLSTIEVTTLASIVEEETNSKAERPKVAGLYINRLKQAMPLQADPTLKFAIGNFAVKRLGLQEILYISPYNTYRNKGLPPGPIRIASPAGIDAVLHYTKHNYVYMCAKETFNGEHNFAPTYAEHQANARLYQQALNNRKIFK